MYNTEIILHDKIKELDQQIRTYENKLVSNKFDVLTEMALYALKEEREALMNQPHNKFTFEHFTANSSVENNISSSESQAIEEKLKERERAGEKSKDHLMKLQKLLELEKKKAAIKPEARDRLEKKFPSDRDDNSVQSLIFDENNVHIFPDENRPINDTMNDSSDADPINLDPTMALFHDDTDDLSKDDPLYSEFSDVVSDDFFVPDHDLDDLIAQLDKPIEIQEIDISSHRSEETLPTETYSENISKSPGGQRKEDEMIDELLHLLEENEKALLKDEKEKVPETLINSPEKSPFQPETGEETAFSDENIKEKTWSYEYMDRVPKELMDKFSSIKEKFEKVENVENLEMKDIQLDNAFSIMDKLNKERIEKLENLQEDRDLTQRIEKFPPIYLSFIPYQLTDEGISIQSLGKLLESFQKLFNGIYHGSIHGPRASKRELEENRIDTCELGLVSFHKVKGQFILELEAVPTNSDAENGYTHALRTLEKLLNLQNPEEFILITNEIGFNVVHHSYFEWLQTLYMREFSLQMTFALEQETYDTFLPLQSMKTLIGFLAEMEQPMLETFGKIGTIVAYSARTFLLELVDEETGKDISGIASSQVKKAMEEEFRVGSKVKAKIEKETLGGKTMEHWYIESIEHL